MISHIRGLSSKARLREFILSESGETNAQKAAQVGAILATSALATLLMSVETARAGCDPTCVQCNDDADCTWTSPGPGPFCRTRFCFETCDCVKACTWSQENSCIPDDS